MSKRRKAKALKTSNNLAQSWSEIQARHGNWPKFGNKYSRPPAQSIAAPKLMDPQVYGTVTGRMSSTESNMEEMDRVIISWGRLPGQRTVRNSLIQAQNAGLLMKGDFSEIEHRVIAASFDIIHSQPEVFPDGKAAFIERFGQEEWDRREKAAREVKHTVMPGHKQGYQLVTDPEMIPQMGKKTA
jgi:hypothetical protein